MEIREFVRVLDEKGLLTHITKEVDPQYEIPAIIKELGDTPVIFDNVKGSKIPVVSNLCASRDLISLALNVPRDQIIKKLSDAIENPTQPKVTDNHDYTQVECDLSKIPILTYYKNDGGPYVSSGIAIAKDDSGINTSFHRAMVAGEDKMILRILQRDFDSYIKRGLTEFAYCIGSPINVLLGSSISTDKSELDISNSLLETQLIKLDGHLVPKAEIVMIMEFTGDLEPEGPYVDLTETSDIVRDQRVARVKRIYMRPNPLFHGLLAGDLEHKTLMGMPREPSIYREVSKVCQVKDVLISPGGCSWLHGIVSITKKSDDDAKNAISAAFQGHKSMKHVFIVDDDINIHDPQEVEWAMATRLQGEDGIIIKKEKGSSLDPSADEKTRETSKVGFDMTIPMNAEKSKFKKAKMDLNINLEDYLN